MSASLSNLFLILFLLISLGFWLTVFILFYHLVRFGIGTQPKKIALLFLLGSTVIFFAGFLLLNNPSPSTQSDNVAPLSIPSGFNPYK